MEREQPRNIQGYDHQPKIEEGHDGKTIINWGEPSIQAGKDKFPLGKKGEISVYVRLPKTSHRARR